MLFWHSYSLQVRQVSLKVYSSAIADLRPGMLPETHSEYAEEPRSILNFIEPGNFDCPG